MTSACGCTSHNGFLTAKGLKEAEQRSLEGLGIPGVDMWPDCQYLDKVGSVSGLRRDEMTMIFDEGVIDEQFQRNFHPAGGF